MTDEARDLVHIFGTHAAEVDYDRLNDDARWAAKKSILDTLGVILAASGLEPAVQAVAEIVAETGGRPDCTMLGFGGRRPRLWPRLANGALAHCLDYDDQTPWGQHAASSVVPAVFAVAERQGGVSGKELIAAVAAGQDIFARLRCNVGWKKDWNLSTVLGSVRRNGCRGTRDVPLPQDRSPMPWESPQCSRAASWRWSRAGAATCAACTQDFPRRARFWQR